MTFLMLQVQKKCSANQFSAIRKNEKTTYVTLFGLEKAKKDVEQISEEAIAL